MTETNEIPPEVRERIERVRGPLMEGFADTCSKAANRPMT